MNKPHFRRITEKQEESLSFPGTECVVEVVGEIAAGKLLLAFCELIFPAELIRNFYSFFHSGLHCLPKDIR